MTPADVFNEIEKACPRKKVPAAIHIDGESWDVISDIMASYSGGRTLPVVPHRDWQHPRIEVFNLDGEKI